MTAAATARATTMPVIGTMTASQVEQAQAETARIIATRRPRHHGRRRAATRLPAYCGCCGCITRYCICSCCCAK